MSKLKYIAATFVVVQEQNQMIQIVANPTIPSALNIQVSPRFAKLRPDQAVDELNKAFDEYEPPQEG